MPGEVPVSLADTFPEVRDLADALRTNRLTLSVAESCTGGLLGAALTALPGSSDFMRGGVIAYADSVKADLLGVSRHELAEHGSVSEPVARAMAAGVRQRCHAAIGLSITGVAGPGGGSTAKPVGLIFVGIVTPWSDRVVRLEGDSGRDANRAGAVLAALRLCLEAAVEHPPTG
jgi:PncC family amidohydrolase